MAFEKLKKLFRAAKPELTDAEIDDALADMVATGGQPPQPAPSPAPAAQPVQPQAAPQGASAEMAALLAENKELRQQVTEVLKALGEMKTRDDAAQKLMADRAKEEREKALKSKADEYIKAGKFPEAKRAELEADLIADTEGRLQKHYDGMAANPAVNRAAPATTASNGKAPATSDAATDRAQRTTAALAEIAASMPTN